MVVLAVSCSTFSKELFRCSRFFLFFRFTVHDRHHNCPISAILINICIYCPSVLFLSSSLFFVCTLNSCCVYMAVFEKCFEICAHHDGMVTSLLFVLVQNRFEYTNVVSVSVHFSFCSCVTPSQNGHNRVEELNLNFAFSFSFSF